MQPILAKVLLKNNPISIIDAADVPTLDKFLEGTKKQITANIYERNPKARAACLAHYGYTCVICGFNFEKQYGEIGTKYIHVHHLKPLSEIGTEYEIDPIHDLRPVCPNCHAILHTQEPPYTIEVLTDTVKQQNILHDRT